MMFVVVSVGLGHTGLDIVVTGETGKDAEGKNVLAAHTGVVKFAGMMGGYGKLIIISDENGFETYYGHLSKIEVKVGMRVQAGQLIGKIGHTGRATGPHLHFELRKNKKILNPLDYFLDEDGENFSDTVTASSTTGFIWPTTASVKVRGIGFGHTGIDIATADASAFGRPVFAAQAGVIIFAGWGSEIQSGTGNLIIIDNGNGYETRYAHLSEIDVVVGQRVEKTEVIGKIGSTGNSTGPHLHFEMRYNEKTLNPLDYIQPPTSTVK
jgi:murein DD-endopeptidase MepM/ murein hydrolase activator NlpD